MALLTADALIPISFAIEAAVNPIPRIITWCSAPGESIRDCRGMPSQYFNLLRMSIYQERPRLPRWCEPTAPRGSLPRAFPN
jgi:hypothetical protein